MYTHIYAYICRDLFINTFYRLIDVWVVPQARHPEQVQSKAGDHLIVATSVGSETTEESRVRQRSKAKAAGELRAELLATNKPRAQTMAHKLSYVRWW